MYLAHVTTSCHFKTVSCFTAIYALKYLVTKWSAEEAAVLVFDEEYPESGESDVEEDSLFPLPNDLNTEGEPERADIGIPSRTVSPSPPRLLSGCSQPLLLALALHLL